MVKNKLISILNKARTHNRGIVMPLLPVITSVVAVAIVLALAPLANPMSTPRAINWLEARNYAVLAAGEYQSISDKLDALKISADAAVAAAEAAVIAAETAAAKVDLFNSAEVFVYPATTNVTCVFTAGNTNVWSAWTEVIDSGATTLSSKFAISLGYISDIHAFLPSDASDGYNIELAYGDAKTILGRVAFWISAGGEVGYNLPIKSRRVSTGETVYYRMQSTGAAGATLQIRIRYFYE